MANTTEYVRKWRDEHEPKFDQKRIDALVKYARMTDSDLLAELHKARGKKADMIAKLLRSKGVK